MRLRLFPTTILALALFPGLLLEGCRAEPDEAIPPPPRPAAVKKPAQPPPPCASNTDTDLTAPFTDNFDRQDLGDNWRSTSYGAYFLRNNKLCIAKPRNHPLWLK